MNIIEQAKAAGVEGFLHFAELEKLMELATGREVLEVGAFMGLSAWGMAQTAKSVFSVDTYKANTAGQQQQEEFTTLDAYQKAVAGFSNVSWYVGTSEQAAVDLAGDWDMIFLDAMHDYSSVKSDIIRWWPRVRHGGLLVFHDYGHGDFPGVKQAVDEFFGRPIGEPARIVTLAWVCKTDWEFD